jgi:hypothetical protein
VEDCNWDDDEDCIECERNCLEFNYIKDATVKIYDGPLKSLPLLLETKTNATGHFTYTFPTAQRHLIEIFPKTGNYNDFYYIYDLYSCGHAQDTTIKTPTTPKDIILEYPIQGIKLSVQQTTTNKTESFTINETIQMPLSLENTIRHFELTATSNEFQKIEIQLTIENINKNTTTSLKWYNPNTKKWEDKNSRIEKNEIIFDATSLGIYAITQEVIEPEPQQIIEEEIQEQEEQNQEEQSQEEQTTPLINETTTKSNKNLIIGAIIGASLLFLITIFMINAKNKQKHYHQNKPLTPKEPPKEVLTTYNATYQQAIKYVQQYKDNYGKDSLYRALEKANVPRDIIDRVFIEEY